MPCAAACWRTSGHGANRIRQLPIPHNWSQDQELTAVPPRALLSHTASSEARDWDVSHNPSWANRQFARNITRQQVIDNYQEGTTLECQSYNRSGQDNDERFGPGVN
jgi:hypothetical protein